MSSPRGNAVIGGILNVPAVSVPTSTFNNGDNIQATGLNNTFNIASASESNVAGVNATVSGVQNVRVTASGAINFDVTGGQGWTGLTSLTTNSNAAGNQNITVASTTDVSSTLNNAATSNVTVNGGEDVSVTVTRQTSGGVSVNAPTGAVNVSASVLSGSTQGPIAVNGGSTVSVSTSVIGTNTPTVLGSVTVNGAPATTAVTVNQPASSTSAPVVTTGVVEITDANALLPGADSISTVSLSNYGNLSRINSSALSSLSLAGVFNPAANLTINGDIDANNQTLAALNLNLSNFVNAGTVFLAAASAGPSSYTTVNLQSSALGSSLGDILSSGTISNLNISGAAPLTLGGQSGLTSNGTITSTSSGGVTLNTALLSGQGFSGASSSGNDNITVGSTTRAINVGRGNNTVTFTTPALGVGGSVTATGSGTNTIRATSTVLATASSSSSAEANFAAKISGFNALDILTGVSPVVIDIARLDNIANVTNSGTSVLNIDNFVNGGSLIAAATNTNFVNFANTSGSSDTLNYGIATAATATPQLAVNGAVEVINIGLVDTDLATPNSNTLNLTAPQAQNITIAGNTGLALTFAGTALTSLNASATSGGFSWTSGALTASSTIVGSATASNNVNLSSALASVTYTGGTGINSVTTGSANDTVNGGTNADALTAGSGQDVINSGGNTSLVAVDQITGGLNADTISVAGSPNAIIIQDTSDSGENTANNIQTSLIATGFDRIIGTTNGVQLDLPNFSPVPGPLVVNVNVQNLAGTNNAVNFATGTFANGTFTFNPNGLDTLATYDTDDSGIAFQSVVLTGFVAGNQTANTSGLTNVITLSTLNV